MPQITVNSININKFGFSATFNPALQRVVFDTSSLTTYNNVSGSGYLYVQGICFSLVDQDGVKLLDVDWNNPQITPALSQTSYTLDLSNVGIDFFFQTYKIIGYIKDANNIIYQTTQVNKNICQPTDVNSDGTVSGLFQVTANCLNNALTVKEVTKLTYNNEEPESFTKSGTLSYPTGTISPISFTGTPFTNNIIYTGQYRIVNTTTAIYNIGDDIYVAIQYYTNNVFDITCLNRIQDILCCIVDLQRTRTANCNTRVGERAAQLEAEITIPFLTAIGKEFAGQDASNEVEYIRKKLNCSCGGKSILRNEFTPTSPSVSSIAMNGVGGTTILPPTINGNTKTFNIQSNTYIVSKDNALDTAFSITVDNSVANVVRYKIAINYTVLAATILSTIGGNSTLLTQFNGLINITNFTVDLTNLNGGCIISLASNSYFLSLQVPASTSTIENIIINGTTYSTASIVVSNEAGIESWLNGLGLGTFSVGFSNTKQGAYINILTNSNANIVTSADFNLNPIISSPITVLFQKTNKSLIAFLQAVVDYICNLSALQVVLGQSQTVCYVDYNGNTVTNTYSATELQSTFNTAVAQALCSTVAQINNTFNNALEKSGTTVQWGGKLIKNTIIDQNAKYIRFLGDANNYVDFGTTALTDYRSQGNGGTDLVNILFNTYALSVQEIATNADRTAVAYYAKSTQIIKSDAVNGDKSVMGAYYPTTNGATPAPALNPTKTAYVEAFYNKVTAEGEVNLYGKTHTHTGSVSNFDTLLRAKKMTTAQRNAIDVSLLTAAIIIFNTDVTANGKLQCYDGTSWNNLW